MPLPDAPAAEYARVSKEVGLTIEGGADRTHAARICLRAAALALMFLAGPKVAAEALYLLADEMADATRPV